VLTVFFDGPVGPIPLSERLPRVSKVEVQGDKVRVFARGTDGLLPELIAAGAAAGRTVRDVTTVRPSLESAFLALTGKEYRE
jgi:hypothetical protein